VVCFIEDMKNKYEDKILKVLKDHGRMPTSRIAAIIGVTHEKALTILQVMWEEEKIIGEVETLATYWKLKEEEK